MPEAAVRIAVLDVKCLDVEFLGVEVLGVESFSAWTVAVATVFGSTTSSALAGAASLPRSTVTSRGPGAKLAAGPSGLGDNTALERSRLRNSLGLYCCAAERPLQATIITPRAAKHTRFKTIKASHSQLPAHPDYLGDATANSSGFGRQGYRSGHLVCGISSHTIDSSLGEGLPV